MNIAMVREAQRNYHAEAIARLLYQNRLRTLRCELVALAALSDTQPPAHPAPGLCVATALGQLVADIDDCLAAARRCYGDVLALSESGQGGGEL